MPTIPSNSTDSTPVFQIGRHQCPADRCLVMGILNITPDSFSDGGQHFDRDRAIAAAHQMVDDGADLIDIGGESTRPGAQPVSVQEECDRVLPVIEALQGSGVPLSLDSRRAKVVQQAMAVGIDLVNDVDGFRSAEMRALVPQILSQRLMVCVMHMQGQPQTMQVDPHYDDVVSEVYGFLMTQRDRLMALGLEQSQILLDPGFGFGKNLMHNQALFTAISDYAGHMPLLIGVSRKRMIGQLSGRGEDRAADRLGGSIAAAVLAAQAGARVVRVHDVRQTVDALRVTQGLA
ncbi:MAG: dihydropteroate synthase [Burkholderiaceae bacterium]